MDPAAFRIGVARREISPPRDCPLIGYDQRAEFFPGGGNDGVHDPLFVTALVIESGGIRRVLLSLDLAIIETPGAGRLRDVVADAAATAPGEVIISCTHTHSGPFPWKSDWAREPVEPVADPLLGPASEAFAAALERQVAGCVAAAVEGLCSAKLTARQSSLAMGYTRRVRDGKEVRMAWNLREWDGPEPEPCRDPAFVTLTIERKDAPPVFVWNVASHPVVLGKTSNVVSADWPGAARRMIEEKHPGAIAIFLHGAGGDAHPWLATGSDPADLDVVAAPAASLLLSMNAAPGGLTGSGFAAATGSVGGAVELAAWRLGPVKVLAAPCELFGATGAAIRARCDAPLLLATTSNGWAGYWPPADEFPLGGYEIECSPGRRRGDAEALAEQAVSLLDSLP